MPAEKCTESKTNRTNNEEHMTYLELAIEQIMLSTSLQTGDSLD